MDMSIKRAKALRSKRIQRALDVLEQGGRWVYCLRGNRYLGREQFGATLEHLDCSVEPGFGTGTFITMRQAGLIQRDITVIAGSAAREEWRIYKGGVA